MSDRRKGLLGLLILCVGGAGLYLLSRQAPGGEEAAEADVETVVPVAVGQIQRLTLHDFAWVYGSIIPNPGVAGTTAAETRIRAPLDGIITEVRCSLGQPVSRGQVLFSLDDRLAQTAVDQAQETLAFAEANVRRQDSLKDVGGTSARLRLEAQQQLDIARNTLRSAETDLALFQVTAPCDGRIVALSTTVGAAAGRAEDLALLTDMTRLVVKAGVPTVQAHKLQLGQPVRIEVEGASQSGRLDYIDFRTDPNNDTVAVLIALPADTHLRPGQVTRVRITLAEYNDRLAVPTESLVKTLEGQTVIALVQGDEAIPTPVRSGVREGDWVEVDGPGLDSGMTVVTVGAYGLPGRTKIRVMGP